MNMPYKNFCINRNIRIRIKVVLHIIEDNIVKPAGGLAGALALVELAFGSYSEVVAHMPKKLRKNKNLSRMQRRPFFAS
jgi:hypothetical protein